MLTLVSHQPWPGPHQQDIRACCFEGLEAQVGGLEGLVAQGSPEDGLQDMHMLTHIDAKCALTDLPE